MSEATPVQRLRIVYTVEGPLRYISVLDKGSTWERLLRRAHVPMAYSQGYNPRPKLQLGTALPVGYSSECELLDVFMARRMPLDAFLSAILAERPPGLGVRQVCEVPLRALSVQARLREALYEVQVWSDVSPTSLRQAIEALMACKEATSRRRKGKGMVEYDLRPLILDIRHEGAQNGVHRLFMHLRNGPEGSGRPEEVLEKLGMADVRYRIHRKALILAEEE
ncbi:MAG: DUF2344 domain-containing protein [Chloroflexi bacterium]|nr:DUF2344 domain-containing protein [Chloroflexota bacterium]